MLYCWCY